MTTQELNETGFIFIASERSIESIIYRDYLCEHGKDGATDSLYTHEVLTMMYKLIGSDDLLTESEYDELDEQEQFNYAYYGEIATEWEIRSHAQRERIVASFDNEEDAELFWYEKCEWYISEKNWNAPRWFDTYNDAIEDMAASVDKSIQVCQRYLALAAITAKKDAEHRKMISIEYEARKARLAIEVPAEAATISIDDVFRNDVKEAMRLTGNDKSNSCAAAMKALLSRNVKEKIDSDFWQVFRILKNK